MTPMASLIDVDAVFIRFIDSYILQSEGGGHNCEILW